MLTARREVSNSLRRQGERFRKYWGEFGIFREADVIRVEMCTAWLMRQIVTKLGDTEEAWTLAELATEIERNALAAEADLDARVRAA